MKITRRQLKRIIREEFRKLQSRKLVKESPEEFGRRFDSAYKMPSGRFRGQPDEPMPGTETGVPVEVDELGKELWAAYQAGDEREIQYLENELRAFGDVGEDEIYYRSPQGKNVEKSEWDY